MIKDVLHNEAEAAAILDWDWLLHNNNVPGTQTVFMQDQVITVLAGQVGDKIHIQVHAALVRKD